MSTAATLIPAYAAITLLMGGFNGLSIQLTLVGILAIIIHAAITPTDLSGPYPNFDNYHPTQPPFRDYVLVFGLASLALAALFSRIYPFVSSFTLLCLNHTYFGSLSLPAPVFGLWPARPQDPGMFFSLLPDTRLSLTPY